MDPKITAAIILATGGLVGAFITTFAHELKALVSGQYRHNRDLLGRWKCEWSLDQVPGKRDVISDVVDVTRIAGEKITAEAVNRDYGDYKITGRLSPSLLLTMHYVMKGANRPLGGVVILELNARRDHMVGYWHEYTAKREFVGGKTEWHKAQ